MDKNNITGGFVMGIIAGAVVGLAAAGLLEKPVLGALIGVAAGVIVLILFLRSVSPGGEQADQHREQAPREDPQNDREDEGEDEPAGDERRDL